MAEVHPTLLDRYELSYFSGLQDQRATLARVNRLSVSGGGVDVDLAEDDMAITNRSPTITHNYPAPVVIRESTPWAYAALVAVLLTVIGITAWLYGAGYRLPSSPVIPANPPVVAPTREDYQVGFFQP